MLEGLRKMFPRRPAPTPTRKRNPAGEALKRDWLELWYQPKIESEDQRLIGAEALVRARHPTRGIVGPFFFLPDAEEPDLLR